MFRRFAALILIFSIMAGSCPEILMAHDSNLGSGMSDGPPNGPDNAGGGAPVPAGAAGGKGDGDNTDPVILHSGELRMAITDLYIPSRGLDFNITRVYRSKSDYNGPFGYGWDFNFNIRLRRKDNGDVVILTGDNRTNEYKFQGGTYVSPPSFYDSLVKNADGSYTLTTKYGMRYDFDAQGKLTLQTDRNGNTLTYSYDPRGKLPIVGKSQYFVSQPIGVVAMDYRLTQITDSLGRSLDFYYNANGRLEKIKDFTNRVLTYRYSADGDLEAFADPALVAQGERLMGYQMTYGYTDHNLETATDALNQTYLVNVYNNEDRVIEQTYGNPTESGGTTTIDYNTAASQTTVIDRKGNRVVWTFNENFLPIRVEEFTKGVRPGDPVSFVTQYEYNDNFDLTKIIYPKGNITEYLRDPEGNVLEIRQKGQDGHPDIVEKFTYESRFNQVKTYTDPRDYVTTHFYDYELGLGNGGNLSKTVFPSVNGQTIEANYTYNAYGQRLTASDPNQIVTQYTYYPDTGYLRSVTGALGTPDAATVEITYDAVGNAQTIRNARNHITIADYNDNNQITKLTQPAPFVYETNFYYYDNGDLERVERQSDQNPSGFQITRFTYTMLNQLKTLRDHDLNTTTYEYDPNGNVKRVIDAENKVTRFEYDERDLMYKAIDALNGTTTYNYDPNGNLSSIKDANLRTTTYQYDEFDRVTGMIYPDGLSSETYTYDASSNLETVTDSKLQTVRYDYDALDRVDFKTYVNCPTDVCGGNVDYVYDAASRLIRVSQVSGGPGSAALNSIDYDYDALARVKEVRTQILGNQYITTSRYDGIGNRQELIYPHGRQVKFLYDELNRLDTIQTPTGQVLYDYGYDALSRRTSLTRPNGVFTNYGYDRLSRLTHIHHGSLWAHQYPLYDRVGNQKEATDSRGTLEYTYNDRYELTLVSGAVNASYAYDLMGSRMSAAAANTPSTYIPNFLNQYNQVNGVTFTYDPNGNLTGDGTHTYEYDFDNRLIRVTGSGVNASYTYDAFGRRLSKTVGSDTVYYIYDGNEIIEERSPGGLLLASYLYGPSIDEPLELTRNGVTHYYHTDSLGSITGLSDDSGNVAERYFYDAFGIPEIQDASGSVLEESAFGNPYLYTGRELDSESGLYYYRTRYYSPTLGRFLTRDTVEGDDVNRYHYVYNNPVNRIDPFGETTMPPPGMRPPPDIYLDPEAWMDWYVEEASRLFNLPAPGEASGTGKGKAKPGNGRLARNEDATGSGEQAGESGGRTPSTGEPNSEKEFPNEKGGTTTRRYGPDGKAQTDIDRGHDHTGAGNPHAHDWDWNKPNGQKRGPARPLRPGEI